MALCFFNKLVHESSPFISIIKSINLFAGIYDLYEFRYMNAINPNNIFSLDENNVFTLSPILFDFHKWTAAVTTSDAATATAINIYVAMNDGPKIVGQAYCLERVLGLNDYPNYELIAMKNIDHFDIVENLSKPNYSITKRIISEAKLYATENLNAEQKKN